MRMLISARPSVWLFSKKGRNLKPLTLGGHCLPMVNSVRHLGNKIENKFDGVRQDMREKRARFIQKNKELCQEFSFADPITKCKLNSNYNIHFMGSPYGTYSAEKPKQSKKHGMLPSGRCFSCITQHTDIVSNLYQKRDISNLH